MISNLKSAAVLKFNALQRRYADPDDPFDPWNPTIAPSQLTAKEGAERFMASRQHLRPKTIEA